MRTTVELSDRHRAKLLELAAERGEKGFSRIIQEAVERYLVEQGSRHDRIAQALKLQGSLGDAAADALVESVKLSRSRWR
jgi:predicted transcriptional regulator